MPMLKLYSPTGDFGVVPNKWSQRIIACGLSSRDADGERRERVRKLLLIGLSRGEANELPLLQQPPLTPETLWLTSLEPMQDF